MGLPTVLRAEEPIPIQQILEEPRIYHLRQVILQGTARDVLPSRWDDIGMRNVIAVSVAGAALSVAMIAGVFGRLFWGMLADFDFAPRAVLGFLGVLMAICAVGVTFVDDAWAMPLVYVLAFLFGASAVGWNGVYLAEVARIAPPGQAGSATGASLAMTYSGVVTLPSVFWLAHTLTESYAPGFVIVGVLTFWRGVLFLRPSHEDVRTDAAD